MSAKINRALLATVLSLCLLALLQNTLPKGLVSTYIVEAGVTNPQRYIYGLLKLKGGGEQSRARGPDLAMAFLNEPIPRRNFSQYAERPPHATKEPAQYAYATLLCTRKPDLRDPFFAATQSLVWRLLWSDWHSIYPVIVYVCPFTPEEQRVILRGQGAIVKEIGLLDDIVPMERVPRARWLDQFSKLNMWKETDYERIAYLDVDALPIANIDDIFTLIPEQSCQESRLSREDKAMMQDDSSAGEAFCNYTFAGVDPYGMGEINGGFLVFKPNLLMYERLIRGAKQINKYDLAKMEQGLLHSRLAFGSDGAFKAYNLPQVFNAVPDYYIRHRDEEEAASPDGPIRVIHDKLWSTFGTQDRPELNMQWDLDWMTMCRFYDSPVFAFARETGRLKDKLEVFLESAALSEQEE